ncbi:MAG: hypothetical protein WBD27_06435 [Pyrinomonadaceae bacterium]
MVMLTVYADESGTDGNSSVVALGGYVSDVDSWDVFQIEWNKYCADNGIEDFHATDMIANRQAFSRKNGWSQSRCDSALRIADSIISKHVLQGFVSYTTIPECEALFPIKHPGLGRRPFAWEYCVAGMGFVNLVKKWLIIEGYTEPVRFVFEKGGSGRHQLEKFLDWFTCGDNDPTHSVGGYSFEDKNAFVQLRAADRLINLTCRGLNEFRRDSKTFDPQLAQKLKIEERYIFVMDEENWPDMDASVRSSVEEWYEEHNGGDEK